MRASIRGSHADQTLKLRVVEDDAVTLIDHKDPRWQRSQHLFQQGALNHLLVKKLPHGFVLAGEQGAASPRSALQCGDGEREGRENDR